MEITRMRVDIAISLAEWEARSIALREFQGGRRRQSTLTEVSPKAQGIAERFETALSARVLAAALG
jgi:hypothetical protein